MPLSKTPATFPVQTWYIPNIVNGTWVRLHGFNSFIYATVPSTCCKCGRTRTNIASVYNQTYGAITKAYCLTGCLETFEEIRIQSERFARGEPDSITKSNIPPWTPDTRVGSGKDDGMTCSNKYCNEYCQFAQANQPNGTFLCRRCRT